MNNNKDADNTSVRTIVDKTSKTISPEAQGWSEGSSDWTAPPGTRAGKPKSSDSIALEAQDLCVSYGTHQALTDIELTLYQGDTLGLLGLNGAGKSTLLKVLSGAMAPERGTVQIGDHELYEDTIASRMSIGYAPDKPAIYPEFRVTEYLQFIAKMRRMDRRSVKAALNHVIDRCALTEVRSRIIGNLSTGYQQRVNIAQALIHSPKILILDEPANGLDPVQLMEMRELISNLAPDQATVFSSHLLSEVNSICNRVMLIDSGRQILDAPLTDLTNKASNSFEVQMTNDSDFNLADLPGITHACRTAAAQWLVTGESMTQEHIKTMLSSRGQSAAHITPTDKYLESLFRHLAVVSNRDKSAPDSQGTQL